MKTPRVARDRQAVSRTADRQLVLENFGLYSERVGAQCWSLKKQKQPLQVLSQLKRVVRSNYSNPPRHGAAVVATVLANESLTQLWHQELTEMRARISDMRVGIGEGT